MEEHPLSAAPDYLFNLFKDNFNNNIHHFMVHKVVAKSGQINLTRNSGARKLLVGYVGRRQCVENCGMA
jgi:hypothetical protein